MAVIGIEKVFLSIVDEKGQPVTGENGFTTGMIEITDEMLGTSSVNFQVSKNGTEMDGNNKELSYIKALPTAQMDISFNNLPFDVENKILGRVQAGTGWADSLSNTYVAVIAKSPTPDMKNHVYICMGKAVATPKGKNMQTNTSKRVNHINDEFSFEGLACKSCGDMPYMVASSVDSGFSEKALFDQICPNQTLISAEKAK